MVRRHIERAVEMFEHLTQAANIQGRLLVVENCDAPDNGTGEAAEQVVNYILKRKAESV